MDPALDSHCDLGGMYTYSPASKCSSALPHQPSRSPRHDQYEISGLTRIFHTDLLQKLGIRASEIFVFLLQLLASVSLQPLCKTVMCFSLLHEPTPEEGIGS